MNDVRIRFADVEDAANLAALLRDIGQFQRINAEPEATTAQNVRAALTQALADDSHTIWIAVDANEVILAYAAVHWLPYLFMAGPEGYLSELFVRQAARGQGLGTRLLAVLTEEARRRGCSRLQLVNFRDRESYQRGFYAKAGWEERPDGAGFVYIL